MKRYTVKKDRAEFRDIASVSTGCVANQDWSDPEVLGTFEEKQAAEAALKKCASWITYDPYHKIYVVEESWIEESDISIDEDGEEDALYFEILAFSGFPDDVFSLGHGEYRFCEHTKRFELVEEGEDEEC